MKLAREDTRPHIRKQPTAHFAVNASPTPLPPFGRLLGTRISQAFRVLRKWRLRQRKSFRHGRHGRLAGVHEQVMHSDVNAESRGRCHGSTSKTAINNVCWMSLRKKRGYRSSGVFCFMVEQVCCWDTGESVIRTQGAS